MRGTGVLRPPAPFPHDPPGAGRPCRRPWNRAARWVAALAFAALPGAAQAGGFEQGEQGARAVGRGGAYAVAAADPTALHFNPGKLATLRGTRLAYSHNLTFFDIRFDRQTLPDYWGDPYAGTEFPEERDGQRLFGLAPFLVVSSDFGLENWGFALGVYGPSALGKHDFRPYGPTSFQLTEMNVIMAYYSAAVAWKFRDVFGIGVTLQYVDTPKMDYGLVVDATTADTLRPVPDDTSTQMETVLRLKDRTGFTALVGLWGRPHPRVELGVGGRVIPVFLSLRGPVDVDKPELVSDDLRAQMDLTLPVQLRGGLRYIHPLRNRELFDVEVDVVWENWSVIDAYDVTFSGRINGQEVAPLSIAKNWKDTVAVRIGGDVTAIPGHLSFRLGGGYESAAVPKAYSHVDFPSFNRGTLALGATGGGRGVFLTVGYMHIFQERRSITELESKVYQARPLAPCPDRCAGGVSGIPANAGVFSSRYDILSVMLDVNFNDLFAGVGKNRKKRRRKGTGPA